MSSSDQLSIVAESPAIGASLQGSIWKSASVCQEGGFVGTGGVDRVPVGTIELDSGPEGQDGQDGQD